MKKSLFALLALLSAPSAHAAGDFYKCFNVGGTDEWTIEINLQSKKAALFDNDSWSEVPLTDIGYLESMPPQTVYIFEGPDAYKTPIEIRFNQTRLTGSVTTRPGTQKAKRLQAQDGCQAVRAGDLVSGI